MLKTLAEQAERFVGIKEVRGDVDNDHIMAMLKLDFGWPESDEVPWCSAFVNFIAWLHRYPRSKSLRARSWLLVGEPIATTMAIKGFDVVVIKRGGDNQPGPEVIKAQGHVGFYMAHDLNNIWILGGNQGNEVSVREYPLRRLLGIRRLGRP